MQASAASIQAKSSASILVELAAISKSFVGVPVLKKVGFSLRRGEVLMLCGENGSGKSTLKNILSGMIRPDAGEIKFGAETFAALSSADVERLGVGTIHQELSLFGNLSVAENIHMPHIRSKGGLVNWTAMNARASELLQGALGADIAPDREVASLSLGERQLVEIAKAIHRSSSLLILDEPTTCLSIPERRKLFDVVRRLRLNGYGVIYITHFLEEVYELADRIVVLRDGSITATGTADELPVDLLTRAMVGRSLLETHVEPKPLSRKASAVLEVSSVSDEALVRDVSFKVDRGEILGIAGLMGAGRSELAELLVGMRSGTGTVDIEGRRFDRRSPQEALARGLVLVSEDRRKDQAFLGRSVQENITASSLPGLTQRFTGFLRQALERRHAQQVIATYGVQPARPEATMVSLSGGNQQKAIIGRWLSHKPRICILDEPTKGVDVGARAAIHSLVVGLAAQGISFLLISSDLPELLALCHRTLVLHKGRLVSTVDRSEFEAGRILRMASTGARQ